MDKYNDYPTDKISTLQSEIRDLKNRQIVAEVQLEHLLEERRWRQELHAKIWQELSYLLWFLGCFLVVVLIISLHYSH